MSEYQRNDEHLRIITEMARFGLPLKQIGFAVGLSVEDLKKHYEKEIVLAEIEMCKKVSQGLYKKAEQGDTVSLIYLSKARLGWSDAPQKVELSGEGGGPVKIQIEVKQSLGGKDGGKDS